MAGPVDALSILLGGPQGPTPPLAYGSDAAPAAAPQQGGASNPLDQIMQVLAQQAQARQQQFEQMQPHGILQTALQAMATNPNRESPLGDFLLSLLMGATGTPNPMTAPARMFAQKGRGGTGVGGLGMGTGDLLRLAQLPQQQELLGARQKLLEAQTKKAERPPVARPFAPPQGATGMYDPATGQWKEIPPGERTPFRPAAAGAQTAQTQTQSDDIADAIANGLQPPVTTGLYRFAGPVRAALAKRGYNLSEANRDWTAIQRHLASLNGPQQERLRQSVTFAYDSLDVIDDLFDKWKKLGGASGYRVLNKAALKASKQIPGPLGEAATALDAQINDLISEMATVYRGGNASTDEALRVASANLSSDWNEDQFKTQTGLMRKNLQIRRNAIMTSGPVGVSPGSPYAPEIPPHERVGAGPLHSEPGPGTNDPLNIR